MCLQLSGIISHLFLSTVWITPIVSGESISPQPQSIPLRPFRFFSKIRGDIHKSRCTIGINDTGGKFFHQFPLCCWYRWQICHRCQRRRWQIATCINNAGGKFATGVNDTGGKQCEQLSKYWQLIMNLKFFLYLYAYSTTQSQRCPKETIKKFLMEDFFHLPPVSTTPVVHLPWAANISANCRKNSKQP